MWALWLLASAAFAQAPPSFEALSVALEHMHGTRQSHGAPVAPISFHADAFVQASINGISFQQKALYAPFFFDAASGVQFTFAHELGFGNYNASYEIVQQPAGQLMRSNGQCRHYPMLQFHPWFAWLPLASQTGTEVIDGTNCSVWRFKDLEYAADLETLLPKRFSVPDSENSETVITFRNVVPSVVSINATCEVPFFCPSQSPVMQTVAMIRLLDGDQNSVSLDQQNTGNLRGDTLWICALVSSSLNISDRFVSQFNVVVNTTFGQYRLCNNLTCIGAESQIPNIGRESFAGLEPKFGGQCSPNSILGTWYSLTTAAKEAGQWKLLNRVRTVRGDCLIKQGLAKLCAPSMYPFDAAVDLIGRALNGTCPDFAPL